MGWWENKPWDTWEGGDLGASLEDSRQPQPVILPSSHILHSILAESSIVPQTHHDTSFCISWLLFLDACPSLGHLETATYPAKASLSLWVHPPSHHPSLGMIPCSRSAHHISIICLHDLPLWDWEHLSDSSFLLQSLTHRKHSITVCQMSKRDGWWFIQPTLRRIIKSDNYRTLYIITSLLIVWPPLDWWLACFEHKIPIRLGNIDVI